MPTALENLKTRRDAIAAELAAITASKTTESVDGESYQHDQHRQSLIKELQDLNTAINQLGGAWEVETQLIP
ncbi:MAG: hypothetical protein MI757_00040 [Pirellulales bacterium]|nr:hypothetical protein [Pirellulales bacterium]